VALFFTVTAVHPNDDGSYWIKVQQKKTRLEEKAQKKRLPRRG
jgi:hypothetical protein